MARFDSLLKLFGRMTIYGIVLGATAGALVGVTMLMGWGMGDNILDSIASSLILGILYGGIFGGIYGSMGGLFSGTVMTFVTALGYREVRNPQRYKLAMGTITALMTGGTFLFFGLFDLGTNDMVWLLVVLISVAIAVYASQIAARKYIRELSVRKEKAKV